MTVYQSLIKSLSPRTRHHHILSITDASHRIGCTVRWKGENRWLGWLAGCLISTITTNQQTKLSLPRTSVRVSGMLSNVFLSPWMETSSCSMLELGVQDSVPFPLHVPRRETHTLPSS